MGWRPWIILLVAGMVSSAVGAGAETCDKAENLVQTAESETTITIEWDIATPPLKYRITIDGLINIELLCGDQHCQYEISGLSACNTYDLSLVAVCDVSDNELDSDPALLTGNTAYSVPGSVSELEDDGSEVVWSAPSENAGCVTGYQVCYTSEFSTNTACDTVTDTTWNYNEEAPSGCDTLSVSVSAATGDGNYGPSSSISVNSAYGLPSEPTNYEVNFISSSELELKWDLPLKNPACIKEWSIQYGPIAETLKLATSDPTLYKSLTSDEQEFSAEVEDLKMCSNYSVGVAAISVENELGPLAVEYEQTEDAAPGEVPNISYETGTDQIEITWGDGTTDACLADIRICYTDPVAADFLCDTAGGGDGDYTIDGLVPCHSYTLVISGISEDGSDGPPYTAEATTGDVAPGPVQNLEVAGQDASSISVMWDAPADYPDCVHQFLLAYTNLEDLDSVQKSKITSSNLYRSAEFSDTLTGLKACADYKIDVWAVSISGQEGPLATVFDSTYPADPGVPQNPQVIDEQVDGVTLLWFAPEERFCVERYYALFVESGSSNSISIWYDPEDPTAEQFIYTFTSEDFKECTTYTLELEAYNSVHETSNDVAIIDVTTACS